MDTVEPELAADHVEFFDERLDHPERLVVGQVGLATSELVVEDNPPARIGERLQRLEIVMCRPGATVQEDDGQLPLRPLVAVDNAVPGAVAAEGNEALVRVHRVRLTHQVTRGGSRCPTCCKRCTEGRKNRLRSSLPSIPSSTSSRRRRSGGLTDCASCSTRIRRVRTRSATTAFTRSGSRVSSATSKRRVYCSNAARTSTHSRRTSTCRRRPSTRLRRRPAT